MSRPRVITGVDDRGRPKAAWADAEPDTSKGYGHMEPAFAATVERRKATPEELAAARARETAPRHLAMHPTGSPFTSASPFAVPAMAPREVRSAIPDAERMQASRQRGAERHLEVTAAQRETDVRARQHARAAYPSTPPPPEEETTVSEPRADYSDPMTGGDGPYPPEPIADTPGADVLLDRLSVAAEGARVAWDAKAATDAAWDIAREALARAYGEVVWVVEPLPAPPDDGHVHQILTVSLADELAAAVMRIEDPEPETPVETAAIDEVEAAIVEVDPHKLTSTIKVTGGGSKEEDHHRDEAGPDPGGRGPRARRPQGDRRGGHDDARHRQGDAAQRRQEGPSVERHDRRPSGRIREVLGRLR